MNRKNAVIVLIAAAVVLAGVIIGISAKNNYKGGSVTVEPAGGQKETPYSESSQEAAKAGNGRENEKEAKPGDSKEQKESSNGSGEVNKPAAEQNKEEEKVYTPTFMFFYSESDADNDKTQEILTSLKQKYTNITFDIRNVDTDSDMAKRYSVEGMTPALIMLNTKNDISAFMPLCKEREKMEDAIEKALK